MKKDKINADVTYSLKEDGVLRCHFFQINLLHVIQIKIPVGLFVEIEQADSKIYMKSKD